MAASAPKIEIREIEVDDIPAVFHLGNELFHGPTVTTLYRTWDEYEVTTNFNQDPELSLVAETEDGRIIGFALGTTYKKFKGSWKYGMLSWLGVHPDFQGAGVGRRLYREMERLMLEEDVRMMMIDTAVQNVAAVEFFKRMGYGKPQYEVWLSKVVSRPKKRPRANPQQEPTKNAPD